MKPLTHVIGQAPKNVIALIQSGKVVDSALFRDGEARPAPDEVVAQIAQGRDEVAATVPSNCPASASTGW